MPRTIARPQFGATRDGSLESTGKSYEHVNLTLRCPTRWREWLVTTSRRRRHTRILYLYFLVFIQAVERTEAVPRLAKGRAYFCSVVRREQLVGTGRENLIVSLQLPRNDKHPAPAAGPA